MSIPEHNKAYWLGSSGPVLQDVPRWTEVEIVREMAGDKFRVRVKAGQGLLIQEWDAFSNEVAFE